MKVHAPLYTPFSSLLCAILSNFLMVLLLYYQVYSIEKQDKWLIENG